VRQGIFQKGEYTLFATANQSFFFFSQNLSASGGNAPLGIKNRSFPDSAGHHRAYKYNKNIPAYLAKGNFVTKMQIIAKAVLTFLGLSAFIYCCSPLLIVPYSIRVSDEASVLRIAMSLPLVIIFITAVVYLLVFKNDWLIHKMAGSGEKLDPETETLWLAASLRIVAILYGLILLTGSIVTILNILALPVYIRPMINEIFTFKALPISIYPTPNPWSHTIYSLFRTFLAIYLLYGWPQFIRYQLNLRESKSHLGKKLNMEGIKNE
jgi:hypothetical protein